MDMFRYRYNQSLQTQYLFSYVRQDLFTCCCFGFSLNNGEHWSFNFQFSPEYVSIWFSKSTLEVKRDGKKKNWRTKIHIQYTSGSTVYPTLLVPVKDVRGKDFLTFFPCRFLGRIKSNLVFVWRSGQWTRCFLLHETNRVTPVFSSTWLFFRTVLVYYVHLENKDCYKRIDILHISMEGYLHHYY